MRWLTLPPSVRRKPCKGRKEDGVSTRIFEEVRAEYDADTEDDTRKDWDPHADACQARRGGAAVSTDNLFAELRGEFDDASKPTVDGADLLLLIEDYTGDAEEAQRCGDRESERENLMSVAILALQAIEAINGAS